MRNSRTADPGGGQGAENRLGSADGHFSSFGAGEAARNSKGQLADSRLGAAGI
jgi:hypothetical protein